MDIDGITMNTGVSLLSEKSLKGYQLVIKHRRSWLEINDADSSQSVGYQLKYVTLISSQFRRCLITFDISLEIFPTTVSWNDKPLISEHYIQVRTIIYDGDAVSLPKM